MKLSSISNTSPALVLWFSTTLVLIFRALADDVFTAMYDAEELLVAENEVANLLDNYITDELERLRKLKEVALLYQSKLSEPKSSASSATQNPIDAFLAVQQLTQNWQPVEWMITQNTIEYLLENAQRRSVKFPSEVDTIGAAIALFRLQDVYNLSASQMASGDLEGVKADNELSAHDCFELGRIAANVQHSAYHTIQWMTEALRRLENEHGSLQSETDILDYLGSALFQQGNVKHALEVTEHLSSLDPGHPAATNIAYYYKLLDESGENWDEETSLPPIINERPLDEHMSNITDRDLFEQLCRGEINMPPEKLSKLYCAYKHDTPFLKLAPFKYELVNIRPTLVVFKHVISDAEINVLKNLATPQLKRSGTVNSERLTTYRVSESMWLTADDDAVIGRINRRVTDMTNFDVVVEDLQIAKYGIGGVYKPHHDVWPMNQPDAGGATVFLEQGVTVLATKHDALFWKNLYPSGDYDLSIRHAGCPILAGTKWIANKWIRDIGQERRRPCHTNRDYYD